MGGAVRFFGCQPNNTAMYYLEAVQQYSGCPIGFITGLGTENGVAAAIHTFFSK
jgi:hypothetical protein